MYKYSLLRKALTIIIAVVILLSVSMSAIATEEDKEPVDVTTEILTTQETTGNVDKSNKEDENEKATLTTAVIGFIGVVIGALSSGIFQMLVTNKTIKNANKQFETQMEQMRLEHKRSVGEKANKLFSASSDRFYEMGAQEIHVCDRLLNELHYLNNLSAANRKEDRMSIGAYPLITTKVDDIVGGVELHQDLAKLLGSLRSRIDIYNAAVEQGKDCVDLEKALSFIHDLIGPINEERFSSFTASLNTIMEYEKHKGKQELINHGLVNDSPSDSSEE